MPKSALKRLNVNVPLDLWKSAKVRAVEEGRTMTDVVTQLLEGYAQKRS
jgi:hypothetical protein